MRRLSSSGSALANVPGFKMPEKREEAGARDSHTSGPGLVPSLRLNSWIKNSGGRGRRRGDQGRPRGVLWLRGPSTLNGGAGGWGRHRCYCPGSEWQRLFFSPISRESCDLCLARGTGASEESFVHLKKKKVNPTQPSPETFAFQ